MDRFGPLYRISLLALVLLLVAACGDTGEGGTGTSETESESTTGDTSTSDPADPSTTSAEPADPEAMMARVGLEIPYSVVTLPNALTVDRMNEAGYDLEIVEFTTPDSLIQAMVAGELDIAETNAAAFFSAVDAGLDAKAIVGGAGNVYVMAAADEYDSCESLDGANVGIHGQQSTTAALTFTWFEQDCPDAEPNIIVIPGSENRIVALAQGQLDASALDVENTLRLFEANPDEFHLIDSFSELDVVHAYVFATQEIIDEKPELVQEFVAMHAEIVEEGMANPDILIEKGLEKIEGSDAEGLGETIGTYVERNIWNPVGQMEEGVVQETLDFYGGVSPYDRISQPSDVADASFLP